MDNSQDIEEFLIWLNWSAGFKLLKINEILD